jgi:hypothetical protein
MRLTLALATLAFSTVAFSQNPITADAPFQMRYATNLNIGDSVVNLSNSGASSQTLCANIYTFDPAEEMISCCSCSITPNALQSLSVIQSLISNPLTPAIPSSVVIKILGSTGTCNASVVTTPVPGLVAWGTTLHLNTSTAAPTYYGTETAFTPASLSSAELTHVTSTCGFIQANGSKFGICAGCAAGGLGGSVSSQ